MKVTRTSERRRDTETENGIRDLLSMEFFDWYRNTLLISNASELSIQL
jgi:hypothetical protein